MYETLEYSHDVTNLIQFFYRDNDKIFSRGRDFEYFREDVTPKRRLFENKDLDVPLWRYKSKTALHWRDDARTLPWGRAFQIKIFLKTWLRYTLTSMTLKYFYEDVTSE
jgi:hypothetical protein